MALTALSPFPADTSPSQLRAALDDLRVCLRLGESGADYGRYDALDRKLQRMATAVSARVEKYAPGAPQAARSEAVIRGVAFLLDTQGSERQFQPDRNADERVLNPRESEGFAATDWQPGEAVSSGWFRRSGAMSMLSPWRVYGVGLVAPAN